jgi:hypothetical protein
LSVWRLSLRRGQLKRAFVPAAFKQQYQDRQDAPGISMEKARLHDCTC